MTMGNSHQSFEKVLTKNFPMTIDLFLYIFKNKKESLRLLFNIHNFKKFSTCNALVCKVHQQKHQDIQPGQDSKQ